MLGVSNDVISMAENFGLEGSKKNLKFPKEVIFDEEFAWFLGLRDGDPDETNFDVGIGNSNPTILRNAIQFFKKFSIQEEQLWLYISTTSSNVNSVKERWSEELGVPKARIRVYYQTEHLNEDYVKMRFSCLLLRLIIEKLRERLDALLESSPIQVRAAYVRGFFDAEGCVEGFGIIVNQRANKKGLANLQRLDRLLTELGINHGKVRFTNKGRFAYIRIPAQSRAKNINKFQEVIGFSSKNKRAKLSELIQIYENGNSINRVLLKNRIPEWMNDEGVSLFDVMVAFCLKRSTARRTMHSLIKEGKIGSKKVDRKWIFIKTKTPHSFL